MSKKISVDLNKDKAFQIKNPGIFNLDTHNMHCKIYINNTKPFSANKSCAMNLFFILKFVFLMFIVYKTKYASSSHQVPANQKCIKLHNVTKYTPCFLTQY